MPAFPDYLTADDANLIVAALFAVSPCGGGSAPFTLARKLSEKWAMPQDENLVASLSNNVVDDYKESCASDEQSDLWKALDSLPGYSFLDGGDIAPEVADISEKAEWVGNVRFPDGELRTVMAFKGATE